MPTLDDVLERRQRQVNVDKLILYLDRLAPILIELMNSDQGREFQYRRRNIQLNFHVLGIQERDNVKEIQYRVDNSDERLLVERISENDLQLGGNDVYITGIRDNERKEYIILYKITERNPQNVGLQVSAGGSQDIAVNGKIYRRIPQRELGISGGRRGIRGRSILEQILRASGTEIYKISDNNGTFTIRNSNNNFVRGELYIIKPGERISRRRQRDQQRRGLLKRIKDATSRAYRRISRDYLIKNRIFRAIVDSNHKDLTRRIIEGNYSKEFLDYYLDKTEWIYKTAKRLGYEEFANRIIERALEALRKVSEKYEDIKKNRGSFIPIAVGSLLIGLLTLGVYGAMLPLISGIPAIHRGPYVRKENIKEAIQYLESLKQ